MFVIFFVVVVIVVVADLLNAVGVLVGHSRSKVAVWRIVALLVSRRNGGRKGIRGSELFLCRSRVCHVRVGRVTTVWSCAL